MGSYRERLGPQCVKVRKVGTIHKVPPRPCLHLPTMPSPSSLLPFLLPTSRVPLLPATQHKKAILTVLCITLHTIPLSRCLLACLPSRAGSVTKLRYVCGEESCPPPSQIQVQKQHHTFPTHNVTSRSGLAPSWLGVEVVPVSWVLEPGLAALGNGVGVYPSE